MSESRHDSPFANSGLVVTIEPDETGSRHPAGRRPLPAARRAAGLPRRRTAPTPRRSSGPATSWPAGRAEASSPAATPAGPSPIDLGADPAARGARSPRTRPADHGPPVPRACSSETPPSPAPSRAGSSPVRIPRDDRDPRRARPSPDSTPAAKGPATRAGSSARPSTASARPGPSSLATRCHSADFARPRDDRSDQLPQELALGMR